MKTAKASDAGKTSRLPKAFRQPIPAARFERSVLGLVEQAKDKSFLKDCFELRDGLYVVKPGVDAASLKRLSKLSKAIAANRGLLKPGPIVAATLLASGTVAFGLGALDPSIERMFERGLEAAFGARAEISALRLSPFRLRLSMASVQVADRDEPMTNLFETGRVEFRLNPAGLLRGRFFVEEASVAAIAVGTPRSFSGALPEAPARHVPAKVETPPAPPLLDLANFDAQALLDRERARLSSPAAFLSAGAAYDAAAERWTSRAQSSKTAVEKFTASAKASLALNPAKISTATEAAAAIATVKASIDSARSVADEAQAVSGGLKSDLAAATAMEREARAALSKDLAYLTSLVDPRSGTALAALEPSLRAVLSDSAERYRYYGRRALELASTIRAKKAMLKTEDDPAPSPVAISRGRDIPFETEGLPRFGIGLLSSSFKLGDADWTVELRALSTDPTLLAEPTSFAIGLVKGPTRMQAKGSADLRQAGEPVFALRADGSGLPVDLGASLKPIGLAGFSSVGDFAVDLSGSAEGIRASLEARLKHPEPLAAEGEFAAALAKAIASTDVLSANFAYTATPGADGSFRVSTNVDALIRDMFVEIATRHASAAAARIESTLRAYVSEELEGKLSAKTGMASLLSNASANETSLGGTRSALDAKLKELEAKALSLGAGALKGITLPGRKP